VFTEAFAPAVLAAVLPLVLALHAVPDPVVGLGWAALTILFCSAIPYAIIRLGVRRGQLTDHHIVIREQRRRPLALSLASVVCGLILLAALGAPRFVVGMVAVMLAMLVTVAAVNLRWKLSAHTAVATGSATVMALAFGPALLVAFAVAAGVGWSRVELRHHTPGQVLVGAVAGALVTGAGYLLVASVS
jgi:hypothetical protein